jgi:uncharacterized protein YijF (DUF1287 family)
MPSVARVFSATLPGKAASLRAVALRTLLALLTVLAPACAHAFSPERLVRDARTQIGKTLYYDPAYARIAYPLGDVPLVKGVCTDVVIRALRHQNIDLQQRVHEDMRQNFHQYPNLQKWGLSKADANIDHRRVPNLRRYFERQGYAVEDAVYQPGDIVTWELKPGVGHIGIVSDKKAWLTQRPLIIHNIGYGAQENDMLYSFTITGHYRIGNTPAPPPVVARPPSGARAARNVARRHNQHTASARSHPVPRKRTRRAGSRTPK